MQLARVMGTALCCGLALLAITAGTATAASPGWAYCAKAVPKNTGNYTDSSCSMHSSPAGTGKYELAAGVGKAGFKGKGGETVWHMVIAGKGDPKIECASFKDSGKVASPNEVFDVVFTFSKCKSLGSPCSSGAKIETVTTEPLSGELGWISKSGKKAGLDLANEAAPGSGLIVNMECTSFAKIRWFGSVIGEQSGDVETIKKESSIVYAVGPYLGELKPGYTPLTNTLAFEGGATDILLAELNGPETGNTWQPEGGLPIGIEGTAVDKGEALMVR
jgi:hypothetical protein